MRYLVTGGAGFIGSHIVDALLGRNPSATVRVVDDLSTGSLKNLSDSIAKIEFHQWDLRHEDACAAAVEGVDVVFHEAALPSVPASMTNPSETHARGSHMTALLLEQARRAGVSKFIHAGSASAYAEFDVSRCHPLSFPCPLSPYAAEKLAAEFIVAGYAKSRLLDGGSLRYFNVYGPRQSPSSPYSGVISKFCEAMAAGKPLTIFGNGSRVRDFVFVKDVVRANLGFLAYPGRLNGVAVNVGTGEGTSILKLASILEDVAGFKTPRKFEPGREGELNTSIANIDGDFPFWKDLTSLHDGLKATYEWLTKDK